ncbi:MAG: hypothetical protein LQ350_007662 [Teloschistes chrysophthalmus]|nr:MAG: hypothetical protein LQ350_007662 [Niorma chrysophthalma]
MFLSVGDILQLSRLAADLYTKGWLVARDAPQEFRDLVHELLLLKDVLFVVHRKIDRDADLYGDPTKRVLQRCFDTLSEFSNLVQKYEKLALQIEEQTEDIGYNGGIQWADTFAPSYDEQQYYAEGPRASFGPSTRTKTIDSAQTLIPPHVSPPMMAKGSSLLSRQRTNQQCPSPDLNDLPPMQKSFSRGTVASSLSDSYPGGDNGRPGKSPTKRTTSDASLEGRVRQMSLGTLRSEDSLGRASFDYTNVPPLEIPEQRDKHEVPKELAEAFSQSFNSIGDEVLDESWIQIATWWLLKDEFHDYSHWENTTSDVQAYVDLLKSSWILDVLIRERKIAGDLTKPRVRKLVQDLLKALKSDLHHRQHDRRSREAPDTDTLLKQDLSLLEGFEQTVEAKELVPRAMDDLTTSQRWITIDKDHGGFHDERIHFRCFVNAQIGQRHERSKSSNAPYVILLWTKTGESEITVSLCNQRDTLNLSRKLTEEDIEDWKTLDKSATAIHLDFPTQSAEINFLTIQDFEGFRAGPKEFFEAVRGRDPRTGELTIFQTVIKSYRNAEPSSTIDQQATDSSPKSLGYCQLRLYEQMDETCWKSVRRLVVSSVADSKKLGSVSHWLPISNVRLQVEDCTVTVSWSDCGHLEKKSGGNYNPYYSYVYRSDQPNQKIILLFAHGDDAQRFEDCILFLTETPPQVRLSATIGGSSAFQETRIYSLFDQDDPNRGYHGIVYAKKSPKTYHCSQVCYVYRDLDFSFRNQNPAEIDLHNVRVPHYISNRHKMLTRPKEREIVPHFREATWVPQSLQLTFSCDDDAVHFLSGLTGWRLKFYRQCTKLVLTDTSQFRKPKKTHKAAEIQLWEKAAPEGRPWTQLVLRSAEADNPWLTCRLEVSGGGQGLPINGVAELKGELPRRSSIEALLETCSGVQGTRRYVNSSISQVTKLIRIPPIDSNDFMINSGRSNSLRRRSTSNASHPFSPPVDKNRDLAKESQSLRAASSSSESARGWMSESDDRSMPESTTSGPSGLLDVERAFDEATTAALVAAYQPMGTMGPVLEAKVTIQERGPDGTELLGESTSNSSTQGND